jgi:predicted transglutaminase-like cysteine proteinase
MRYGLLLLALLSCAAPVAALERQQSIESPIAVQLSRDTRQTLNPGAIATLALDRPARLAVVHDARVASARIAADSRAVIAAKAPGRTMIDLRDAEGLVVSRLELTVSAAPAETTGSLPRNAGPSSAHTPTARDFQALMGRNWQRLANRAAGRTDAVPAATQPLTESGRARPPLGWNQFCNFYASECATPDLPGVTPALTARGWHQLVAINAAVNRRIKPLSDMDHHGVVEHWDYPMDGSGDCEDYALLKRRLLIEAGWPRQALRMTVVRDLQGDGHAVLTVATDHGDLVLDNQVPQVLSWQATGYRFVKRQSATNPNSWVALETGDTVTPAMVAAGARR